MDWPLFLSTFGIIFLAELPDKTFFATLLLAARLSPFPVFLGACGAFAIQCVIAVAAGSAIGLLPARLVRVLAGSAFVIMAVLLWIKREDAEERGPEDGAGRRFGRAAAAAFAVVFVAEWGDLTQIASAALAAKYREPGTILASATLALWAAAGLAVAAGHRVKGRFHPAALQKFAAAVFLAVGLFVLVRAA